MSSEQRLQRRLQKAIRKNEKKRQQNWARYTGIIRRLQQQQQRVRYHYQGRTRLP